MAKTQIRTTKVSVAVPCYNEAVTIAQVIRDFKKVVPEADIFVFDNNSTDDTANIAEKSGATVYQVRKQGKGYVMQAIFSKLNADVVLVVDGDYTYYAEDAPKLIDAIINEEADMVVGNRLKGATDKSMVPLHQLGNNMIVGVINRMFGTTYTDILSGYRAFSRRFMNNIPLLTSGFEIETEITLQALEEGFDIVEIPVSYRSRPEGSQSKLRTFYDGYRIMLTAAILLRDHRPLRLFGLLSLFSLVLSLLAAGLRVTNYLALTELPDAFITGIILLFAPIAVISFGIGLTLNAINTRFRQLKQYLERNRKDND